MNGRFIGMGAAAIGLVGLFACSGSGLVAPGSGDASGLAAGASPDAAIDGGACESPDGSISSDGGGFDDGSVVDGGVQDDASGEFDAGYGACVTSAYYDGTCQSCTQSACCAEADACLESDPSCRFYAICRDLCRYAATGRVIYADGGAPSPTCEADCAKGIDLMGTPGAPLTPSGRAHWVAYESCIAGPCGSVCPAEALP